MTTRITQKEKVLRYLMGRPGRETTPLDVVRHTGLSVNAAYNTLSELSLDRYSRVKRIELGVYEYPILHEAGETVTNQKEEEPREPLTIVSQLFNAMPVGQGRIAAIDSSGDWRSFIEEA